MKQHHPQDTVQDTGQDTLELADASTRLGISKEALRKRVQRGTVKGHKVDGRWHVVLPGARPVQDAVQDTVMDRDAVNMKIEIARLTTLVEQLTGERDYLRQALAHAITKTLEIPEKAESLTGRPWWRRVLGG